LNREFKPSVEVLTRIAEAFSERISMKKTHIHFASRVSWNSYDRYLNWLENKKYVYSKSDGNECGYYLTQSGQEMFVMILKLKEYVSSFKK